jgi:prepilin signal peptidase PulO-like enzyme (type II secretory pathway)
VDRGVGNIAEDATKRAALVALFIGIAAIATGYAAAFNPRGTPAWAPWLLAIGIPVALVAVMILGAARGRRGIGTLKIPFAFVALVLVIGFGAALALPATEGPLSTLWLGLPARAAIVIYGVGLLPIIVLPVAYALTFETQTLNAEDVALVRALGRENQAARESAGAAPRDNELEA